MFKEKRTVRAPDGRLVTIDQSGVIVQPDTKPTHRQSENAPEELCYGDPSQVGAKIDPSQIGARIDPGQHGARIDPSQLGARIDPAQFGARIQPTA